MKTVGLMTCYMDNFGACLQAYALQKSIKKAGFVCEIIKYTPISSLKERGFSSRVIRWTHDHVKAVNNYNYRYGNYRHSKFVTFRKNKLRFSKQNYLTEKELFANPPEYDVFVTGSDQIWNPNLYGGHINRAYFLEFVPQNTKCVAYAPSIGISSLSDECEKEMSSALKRFSAVSVREIDGKKIIDKISDCGCRVVLDPTLLLNKKEWESMIGERLIKEDYILLYLFSDREYIGQFVEYAHKKLGCKVVTIPFNKREYCSNHKKIKKAGPLEFLNLIKNAKLVITDSFHATAFSINLNTPFYSLLRNSKNEKNNMNSRIFSILELTDLQDRLISDKSSFPKELSLNVDFTKSDKLLQNKRAEDFEFLKNSLR